MGFDKNQASAGGENPKLAALRKKLDRQEIALRKAKAAVAEQRRRAGNYRQLLDSQRRDVQFLNKTLIRMNNLLKHVYSHDLIDARGMKVLFLYYRLRDSLLPIGSLRRRLFDRFVGYLNLENISVGSPINVKGLRNYRGLKRGINHEIHEQDKLYQEWILRNEPDEEEKDRQRHTKFKLNPTISVVVPVYNTPEVFLQELVESLLRQTYRKWELCMAVSGDEPGALVKIIEAAGKRDRRIKIKTLEENLGIAGNSNQAMSLASGEYISFADHDDRLQEFALFEMVTALNQDPGLDFIYSDEDKISMNGKRRFDPHFKPEYSPDTFRSYNYISHLSVIRRKLLDRIGGFRLGYDGSQDYDLFLRALDYTDKIKHIPKILYHWRAHESSTAQHPGAKTYAMASARHALRDHLQRKKLTGKVSNGLLPTTYRVAYPIAGSPRVAIIIPNKDESKTLRKCVLSILNKTAYQNYQIHIVETGSKEKSTFQTYEFLTKKSDKVKMMKKTGEFNFSAVNNHAAKQSRGDVLLFLNNDMEVINPEWLGNMLEHAQRKDVGAVGAKLYYPDGTVQHGGVILGIRGIAGHSHKYFSRHDPGCFFRLKIVQNLSAVTAACLMIRRDVFEACGGFDERYQLAFGDVDLCLKIRNKKRLVIWTPYAELYHHESKTRGYEDTPAKQIRFKSEQDLFKEKWSKVLAGGDPYYNPHLTLMHEDFSIKSY